MGLRQSFFLLFLSLGFSLGPAFSQSLHEVELTPEQAASLDVFSAQADGEPVKASKKARQFFKRLSKATRSRKDLAGSDYLSADAIFKLVDEQGAFEALEPAVAEVVRDLFDYYDELFEELKEE